MTLNDIITRSQDQRPSQFSKEDITAWVNEIEQRVADEVINRAQGNDITFEPYNYAVDAERELLVPDQFAGVYLSYIWAKQDYTNAEISRYNVDASMADSEFQAYTAWYRRNHYPKCR